jgi:hypothetical protein
MLPGCSESFDTAIMLRNASAVTLNVTKFSTNYQRHRPTPATSPIVAATRWFWCRCVGLVVVAVSRAVLVLRAPEVYPEKGLQHLVAHHLLGETEELDVLPLGPMA